MDNSSSENPREQQARLCHTCGSDDLAVFAPPSADIERRISTGGHAPVHGVVLKGVTSDCKPWPRVMTLAACRACGLIQKPATADWLATIAEVYDAYTIYHQSPGAEQAVFDGASGQSAPRSQRLLSRLLSECRLPAAGRLLDIGCGNGVLLRTFAALAPGWTLAGADLDERHRETVLAIAGVDRFYAGPAEEIADTFDVITMQHVVEHLPRPVELLARLGELLNPGGLLFIQVPNILENPFDLAVVDHASHFAPDTMLTTIQRAGLRPIVLATDWAPKELTVAAAVRDARQADQEIKSDRVSVGTTAAPESEDEPEMFTGAAATLADSLTWLAAVARDVTSVAAEDGGIGVLGTSIAGTWVGNTLEGAARFFVDEDPDRIGRPFMERPVIHPSSVPEGAAVYVAFPPAQARSIQSRLTERYPAVRWLVPPER
jgi:2-polyprenyl-3-methyl-5-hydroxy-6-metoxy-1,4-benzoquinol methylase